jgi:ubiquinone/menaquinone biosynthesis C-methylase UbiE
MTKGLDMGEVANLFADGRAYERRMGRWTRAAGEAFLDWLGAPMGLKWLDVGCGNGAFTEALMARCAPTDVAAIDPSEGQLSYARARPGAKMAQFRVGDAQSLPFSDSSFDAAAMALVISYLSDPIMGAVEMARVVRPGGWIAAYMWDIPGGGHPVEPIYLAVNSLGMTVCPPPGSAVSRLDNMRAIWKDAGLQSIETQVIRIPVVYSNFDDFWESNSAPVGPSGRMIHDLSPTAREQLQSRLREQLPIGSDGRIAYKAFANAVKGRVRSYAGASFSGLIAAGRG